MKFTKLSLTVVLRKDKVNKSNQLPIVIRVSYANKKSRVGIEYWIEPKQWNSKDELQ